MMGKKGKSSRPPVLFSSCLRLTFRRVFYLLPFLGSLSEGVLRCEPGTDKTNGFFVSCFTRASPASDLIAASKKATKAKPTPAPAATSSAVAPTPSASTSAAEVSKKSKNNKKRKAAAVPATNAPAAEPITEAVAIAEEVVAKKAKVEEKSLPTPAAVLEGWKGETGGEGEGAANKKKKKRGAKKKGGAGAAAAGTTEAQD